MNRRLFVYSLFFTLVVSSASAKQHPDSDYQDGALVNFRTIVTGSDCKSSEEIKGSADDGDIKAESEGKGSCSNSTTRVYAVKIGENTFEIEALPVTWNRTNALEKQLPGYRFRVRSEKGKLFIKIDNRETSFEVLGAR